MQRRRLLATAGLALGTAGCLGIDDGDDATGTTTTTTASTEATTATTTNATTTASATLDVTEATLQQALVFLETDYLSTTGGDGRYLLANAFVSEGRVDRRDVALRVDGTEYGPDDGRTVSRLWRVYQSDSAFESDLGGLLLFELPASGFDSTSDAAVTWPGGEHRLRAGLRERLRADAPAFSVSIDAPDTLAQGESPTFDVAVTNDGTVPGRFVAGLNRYGPRVASIPAKRFSILVDAGATERTSYTGGISGFRVPDDQLDDGDHDLRYGWNGAADDRTFPIEYVAADG
ncbi:hypothetical protein G9C85_07695 [Halorubellus sp. JP-L1]|uniref:hypothetical protein n=1 Tax=Halorubellus sp. JP-L1 TaxID=2715753 RepID=UPI00140B8848|nr:hypothetical protein [Halorubellus sp. JP-L1]NHN41520.1 hypothetical protein [Halorubellus sp. JP-L1]